MPWDCALNPKTPSECWDTQNFDATNYHVSSPFSFRHFTDQLYCSGSEERLCVRPGSNLREQPGECYWYKKTGSSIIHNETIDKIARSSDVWDPWHDGAINSTLFKKMTSEDAAQCVKGKHVFIIGESTTRDLYYQFAGFSGIRPNTSPCMNFPGGDICHKVAQRDDTRITFQFLSSSNSTRELALARNLTAERPPDVVFVYCMAYDWMSTLKYVPDDAMGSACMQLLREAVLPYSPAVPIYLLGPIYPPGMVEEYRVRPQPNTTMERIFDSINRAAGVSCVRGAHGDYKAHFSWHSIRGVIDRYNSIGYFRKRDMIHPFKNAHSPSVQMMLNSMCHVNRAREPEQTVSVPSSSSSPQL